MQSHSRRTLGTLFLSVATLLLAWAASAQQPKPSVAAQHGKLAEDVFKNIKSLKRF